MYLKEGRKNGRKEQRGGNEWNGTEGRIRRREGMKGTERRKGKEREKKEGDGKEGPRLKIGVCGETEQTR
jgi:hypothetical protein